ncbi:hypothetical protein LAZ67_7001419 [Cordylochernes scorpioides]|uniref:Mos1 transposase HTH domain-containing protein n=1 Tax=Cordylochernes scorpioides TaxID=51811 RepID=A0ABY6KQW5_9ARAC|nr:hypothetical protein LAZ67_7001419 [Cordylochernes scorpioides]
MDQRTCIKFCVKNEIKCADAFRMLTVAYGGATLDRSNVYRWYKMFSEGREDVNDEERAGRPSISTTGEKINEVEKMILANRRITIREVAEDLNISIGSCHSIFINDLGMRRVAAKFLPKLLNCDQKQHRMNIAKEMLDSVRDDLNFLQRVITGNEAWFYGYDVETKVISMEAAARTNTEKARQVRSNVKFLLTVFFNYRISNEKEEKWEDYLYRAERLLEQARNLGADIEDEEFITSVMRGLPHKYNLIVLQLSNQEKLTIFDLRNSLKLYHERFSNDTKEENSSAFKVYSKDKYIHYKEMKNQRHTNASYATNQDTRQLNAGTTLKTRKIQM